MQKTVETDQLSQEILQGLAAPQKYISSKYFYDANGSKIFQKIMQMPEYYPTLCESEIFETYKRKISAQFCTGCCSVDLVELGAGDGLKTRILISDMLEHQVPFRYIPVDISEASVLELTGVMRQQFPGLSIQGKTGDYLHMVGDLSRDFPSRKVIMFLGSNLGNYNWSQSIEFLEQLNNAMSGDDLLFIGLDLKKDPEVIRKAYDDPHGNSRDFNLNLLHRMNRELGTDFIPDHFIHSPCYDPQNGTAKSYLVSTRDQEVHLSALDKTIGFNKWETVYTEMSQKYDLEMVRDLATSSGFIIAENFLDHRQYFVNSLWRKA